MKKIKLILLFLIGFTVAANAQKNSGFGLFTDRDIYVSGETLLAKIYIPEANSSRIIYLDLVNRFGTRISGVPLEIKNSQADGFLLLPDSLSTGNYLLRTYQKHNAAKHKVIREIWISNRFDEPGKAIQMNRVENQNKIQEKETDQISIEGIEPQYQINQPFGGNIRINPALLNEINGELLVSVAQTDHSFAAEAFLLQSDSGNEGMPEKRGIILSGIVTDKKTNEAAANITVYLTIPDSVPGFQYYKTKNDGRFYFLLDKYYGSVEAVIQCFGNTPDQRMKITLDDLFAAAGELPKFRQEAIQETFRNNIARNIDAVTFQKVFTQKQIISVAPVLTNQKTYPYYGKATETIDPQLFIDLPDFTEISRELLPGVKFRNYNNEPSLQVLNSQARNFFEETPLLLIDGIPIRDLNVIKEMGTKDIDRVDICKSDRFYGDLRFPGVVAIYTTKSDYSMLPESDQLIRLTLETIQEPATLAETNIPEPNIPDLRQVVYWNPKLKPAENLPIKCSTSSVIGHYKIIVRGKLKDGTLIFSEKQFEVK
ncbi:MAG: hypothetical protein A2066_19290 [Bacteroidetes bacterium GWB2_41_8]|nr:MAG: hypothetical protein A2066_19290 [Bacteroidetes bacterium GWB2_41_8]